MYFRCIQFASFAIMRIFTMNFRKIFRFYPVKFCWNLKTKEPGFTDHMEFKTSKRSSRMRTARFCSFTGVYPTPPVTLSLGYPTPDTLALNTLPLGCLPLGYPTPTLDTLVPGKNMGPGTKDTLPLSHVNRLTDTCENITFPQLLWCCRSGADLGGE